MQKLMPVLGPYTAFIPVLTIDVPSTVKLNRPPWSATNSSQTVKLDLSRLTRNDWLLAKKSMYYFDLNYHLETELWDSVQGYHHATMWDIASGISATLASYELNLISREEVRDKLSLTLDTLATITLYQTPFKIENAVPNTENHQAVTATPKVMAMV
ncbi:DUF3131 domain-containing protein [Vibrio mediterranei]